MEEPGVARSILVLESADRGERLERPLLQPLLVSGPRHLGDVDAEPLGDPNHVACLERTALGARVKPRGVGRTARSAAIERTTPRAGGASPGPPGAGQSARPRRAA